ncbi:MAG TPA: PLP-dependent aminotransferase family protein, partial [Acidimicrobiales bacterium]
MIRDLLRLVDRPGMLSLAGGLPAPELLPVARIDEACHRVLAAAGTRALQYGPTEGMDELRSVVAADQRTPIDEVVITTGSQQAIDLLARCLLDPGDVVVVESPGYLGALQAFQAAGADVHAVPADVDGLSTERLESRLRAGLRPKLLYVVATFQNPSGATLSPERRRHVAALADEFGFVVVEDDPYGQLRFGGADSVPLRDLTGLAVTLGTASKTV